MITGKEYPGSDFLVNQSSTIWENTDLNDQQSISTSMVHKITTKNHLRGAPDGFGVFALSFLTIGLLIGLITQDNDHEQNSGDNMGSAGGAITGLGILALASIAATLLGAGVGHKNEFILNNSETPQRIRVNSMVLLSDNLIHLIIFL